MVNEILGSWPMFTGTKCHQEHREQRHRERASCLSNCVKRFAAMKMLAVHWFSSSTSS